MPDIYADITNVDQPMLESIAEALEQRSADPQQVEMQKRYFTWLALPPQAKVLEGGCGTGPIARHLASFSRSSTVIGIDPSPYLIERARELGKDYSSLEFQIGDARNVPFDDASFDAVIFHTCLCHVPHAERAVAEAYRVLRPGGKLAVFDGDYATTSFSIGRHDPLQQCAEAMMNRFVHDMWLTRRLPGVLRDRGFNINRVDAHGFVQNSQPGYSFSIVDRGADAMVASGQIDNGMAAALKAEARRRADTGDFYGFINFISLIASRP